MACSVCARCRRVSSAWVRAVSSCACACCTSEIARGAAVIEVLGELQRARIVGHGLVEELLLDIQPAQHEVVVRELGVHRQIERGRRRRRWPARWRARRPRCCGCGRTRRARSDRSPPATKRLPVRRATGACRRGTLTEVRAARGAVHLRVSVGNQLERAHARLGAGLLQARECGLEALVGVRSPVPRGIRSVVLNSGPPRRRAATLSAGAASFQSPAPCSGAGGAASRARW